MKKLRVSVNGVSYDVEVEVLEDDDEGGSSYGFPPSTSVSRPAAAPPPAATPAARPAAPPSSPGGAGKVMLDEDKKELTSPIAGIIEDVKVAAGATVKENDPLIVIEAMKMHTNISSPVAGTVKEIRVKKGDAVQQGQVVLIFE